MMNADVILFLLLLSHIESQYFPYRKSDVAPTLLALPPHWNHIYPVIFFIVSAKYFLNVPTFLSSVFHSVNTTNSFLFPIYMIPFSLYKNKCLSNESTILANQIRNSLNLKDKIKSSIQQIILGILILDLNQLTTIFHYINGLFVYFIYSVFIFSKAQPIHILNHK